MKTRLWLLSIFLIAGCGSHYSNDTSDFESKPETISFIATQNGDDAVLMLPDRSFVDLSLLKDAASNSAIDHSTIAFEARETDNNATDGGRYRIGKYYYDLRWEKHMVYGCINRNLWHLNLHVKNTWTEREIINLHLCVWRDNGPQFGIYNSANGACAKTPGHFTAIRRKIQEYLRRMSPLPAWAYIPIAYTTTIVVVGAFAL